MSETTRSVTRPLPWPAPPAGKRAARTAAAVSSTTLLWRAALPLSIITIAGVVSLLATELDRNGRLIFFTFATASTLWSITRVDGAFVGLTSLAFLVVTGAAPEKTLLHALSSDVIWLLIGAFVIGRSLQVSGLAERFSRFCLGKARTVAGAFWMLSLALIPLAFFLPSTTGRAAILAPIYRTIAASVPSRRVARALALLVPVIVLTSASSSLIAAASHLIVNDFLVERDIEPFSFGRWALLGAPYGVASSLIACGVILWLLIGKKRRRQPFAMPSTGPQPWSRKQLVVMTVVVIMITLWLTPSYHGIGASTVALLGAILLCFPGIGCMSWDEGVRAISWSLLLFVGSALAVGRLLLSSGVAEWLVKGLLDVSPVSQDASEVLLVASLAVVALTSHLYVLSHATRAAVIIPPLFVLVASLGLDVKAVAFIVAMGTNYCLTFPVSSKALQLYQLERPNGLDAGDLMRIGALLLPIHLVLITAFYFFYWKWMGLGI